MCNGRFLTQASGWGIVIGFGAFFALFAGSLVYLDIAFSGEVRGAIYVTHCQTMLKRLGLRQKYYGVRCYQT